MRILTPEQHAQIVEAFGTVFNCRPLGYETMTQMREDKIRAALAVLQALPEGVLYEWKYEDIYGNEIGPPTLFYAAKEPS